MAFFEIAVIGPRAPGVGVVTQCLQCRAVAGVRAPVCTGFGPGCLVVPQRAAKP